MSGKDVLLVISNAAFLIPMGYAAYRHRWTMAPVYALMGTVSAMYHACDSFPGSCVFEYRVHHALDFFFAELLIPLSAFYLILWPPAWRWVHRLLAFCFAAAIFVVQVVWSDALFVQSAIAAVALGILVAYWAWFAIETRRHTGRARFPPYHWPPFTVAVMLTALSISLFSVQNGWHEGYWAVHSVWHVAAALGQTYLLMTRPRESALWGERWGARYATLDRRLSQQ